MGTTDKYPWQWTCTLCGQLGQQFNDKLIKILFLNDIPWFDGYIEKNLVISVTNRDIRCRTVITWLISHIYWLLRVTSVSIIALDCYTQLSLYGVQGRTSPDIVIEYAWEQQFTKNILPTVSSRRIPKMANKSFKYKLLLLLSNLFALKKRI